MIGTIFGFALGGLLLAIGWFLRVGWESQHPRYIVVPDMSEDRDNTAVLQHAVNFAAKLKGRVVTVRVPAGSYRTGPIHFGADTILEGE